MRNTQDRIARWKYKLGELKKKMTPHQRELRKLLLRVKRVKQRIRELEQDV